jgi:uncharacterized caspase-like protein
MLRRFLGTAAGVVLFMMAVAASAMAQSHVALVIGNSAYQTAPALATTAADAEIVAETLRGAGYDVAELHDVRQADIGQTMREFIDKAAAAGPNGVAFVYFAGHAAQSGGENYLVPVDAVINRNNEVADETFRLNDLVGELAKLPLAARVVILDASRDHKLGVAANQPVPKGLAKAEPVPGVLMTFAAAPNAVTALENEAYSGFTLALVTQMRQPGLDMVQILKATQQQVNKATAGRQMPWTAGNLPAELILFAAPAPAPVPAPQADAKDLVDLNMIACSQFLALDSAQGSAIFAWLDGYYKDPKDPPVFDTKAFVTNAKKLAEYCGAHPNRGLIDATDTLFRKPVR